MDNLKNILPITEYKKLDKLYKFGYNTFIFIYKIDNSLVDQFNFLYNYILHQEINKNIMYNELCLGKSDVLFINELDIYYIKMAGNNLILENILIDYRTAYNPEKRKHYKIVETFNLILTEGEDLLDMIIKECSEIFITNSLKIIFYLELLNKNVISTDIIEDIKNKLTNYQLNK